MNYSYDDKFKIIGGNKLYGEINNQTSKNAILPILSASILSSGSTYIKNCPDIVDIDYMCEILTCLGAKIKKETNNIILDCADVSCSSINYELGKKLRSSLFLLGSTLARFKSATMTFPGGCKIGDRPIDIHINALKKLGVKVGEIGNYLFFDAANAKAGKVRFRLPSVGATENIVQFATSLKGKTEIYNAAKEPEVVDLCNFLVAMGTHIDGIGTSKLTIYGVNQLKAIEYMPIPDRIVAGSLMVATAINGGEIKIKNSNFCHNKNLIDKLRAMGCQIETKGDIITLSNNNRLKNLPSITTGYYPDFPTDMQSLILSLASVSDGNILFKEKLFENRFQTVDELSKMGAKIDKIDACTIKVYGVSKLDPATLKAKDLRGGAALTLAALFADGESIVEDVYHIDRGYDHFENMLSSIGANITRI